MKKGKLVPIGGGEDKRETMTVLKTFLDQIDKTDPRIEIITIATNLADEVARDYEDAFEDLNVQDYDFIHIEDERAADDDDLRRRIRKADGVFFSGGNQIRLTEVLCNTKFLDILIDRYKHDGLVVAGTSAGATAMSSFMIAGGRAEDALKKGEMRLTTGLGFLENAIVDTHFTERGRYSRLMSIVGINPKLLGIGFAEDTAAVISNNIIEVIGSGLAVIIDGSRIVYSSVTTAKDGDPLTIEGLTVHLLAAGEKFDLRKRVLIHHKPARKRVITSYRKKHKKSQRVRHR